LLTLAQNWIAVRLSYWNREFFDTVQKGDYAYFVHLGVAMLGLVVCSITFWLAEDYLFSSLKIRWRRWMTDRFLRDWLGDRAHYLGQLGGHQGDNPDQRISEDIRSFVFTGLDLAMQLFAAIAALVSFVVILWSLSSGLPEHAPPASPFPALPDHLVWLTTPVEAAWSLYVGCTDAFAAIPGHLVWMCLAYSLVGMWLVGRVGRPIIGLNYEMQKLEADFRFGLVRLRENSESTALVQGETAERRTLGLSFTRIVGNFKYPHNKNLTSDGYALKCGRDGCIWWRNQIFKQELSMPVLALHRKLQHTFGLQSVHLQVCKPLWRIPPG
jgi:putative ATP-binding cassette transporter